MEGKERIFQAEVIPSTKVKKKKRRNVHLVWYDEVREE